MEEIDSVELERKFLYRLVKVLYLVLLIFGVILSYVFVEEYKPRRNVDIEENKHIYCDNGQIYPMESNNIFPDINGKYDLQDDIYVRNICAYGTKFTSKPTPKIKNYRFEIKLPIITHTIEGTWINFAAHLLINLLITYFLLNLGRQTLQYLFFGVRFSWGFLYPKMLLKGSIFRKTPHI